MNSMYDDYEFENRINNLAWTISGNYDEEINISKENYISKDVAMYFAIMEGARHKYIDWNVIKKYICRLKCKHIILRNSKCQQININHTNS